MLFKELHIPLQAPPHIWCDNMGAISLASNPIYHARTKHVEVHYHFIPEKVLHQDIAISYLSTHDQRADIFTKWLTSARFLFLRDKMMIVAPPISLQGAVKTAVNPTLHDTANRALHDSAEHALHDSADHALNDTAAQSQ